MMWQPFVLYIWTYKTVLDLENEEFNNDFVLYQNYPNPFNSTTRIVYSIPEMTNVSIKLFNSLGEEIKILENSLKLPGRHEVILNDNNLSSGVYYYQIQTGKKTQSKKMILLK